MVKHKEWFLSKLPSTFLCGKEKKIPITINSNHVKMLAIYNKNEEFVSLSLAGVGDKKNKDK